MADAAEYLVRRGSASGEYTFETVVRENSFLDVGRAVGQPVYYQVVARNRLGTGTPSAEVVETPFAAEQFLTTPRLRPAVAGDGQIELSWLSDPLSPGTTYTVKRATSPMGPFETVADLELEFSYTDTGLRNGQTYYYVVQQADVEAVSELSEVASETPQSTPTLPRTVTGLAAGQNPAGVRLSWKAADLAVSYTIERATSAAGPFEPVYRQVRGTSYTDTGVRPGQAYVYRIVAVNSVGNAPASSAASVTVGSVDRTVPTVAVSGVSDRGSYLLGGEPVPTYKASDDRALAWHKGVLDQPSTTTGAGQYTFVASASDKATNMAVTYATYWVRYWFSGFLGRLASPGATFPLDRPVPVVFRLTDAHHKGVRGAEAQVLVDGVPAKAWSGPKEKPNGTYVFLLDPRELSEDLHTLSVMLDDGVTHTATFRLRH